MKSANVSLKYAIYFARIKLFSSSLMMMSFEWLRDIRAEKSINHGPICDSWSRSYPAGAARRVASMAKWSSCQRLVSFSLSDREQFSALGASCLTGFSTWVLSYVYRIGLKRAQRSRWISSRNHNFAMKFDKEKNPKTSRLGLLALTNICLSYDRRKMRVQGLLRVLVV